MQVKILALKQVRSGIHLQKLSKETKFAAVGSIIIGSCNKKAVPKNMV